jgi:hypothetical protein
MLTKDNIRDAASTLAHHWVSAEPKDREGVERLIRSHPVPLHPVLCAHVMRYLELRGFYTKAEQFEGLLFDLAGELVEPETPRTNVITLVADPVDIALDAIREVMRRG